MKLLRLIENCVSQEEIKKDREMKKMESLRGLGCFIGGYAPDYTGSDLIVEIVPPYGLPMQVRKNLMRNSKGYYINERKEFGSARYRIADEKIEELRKNGGKMI